MYTEDAWKKVGSMLGAGGGGIIAEIVRANFQPKSEEVGYDSPLSAAVMKGHQGWFCVGVRSSGVYLED